VRESYFFCCARPILTAGCFALKLLQKRSFLFQNFGGGESALRFRGPTCGVPARATLAAPALLSLDSIRTQTCSARFKTQVYGKLVFIDHVQSNPALTNSAHLPSSGMAPPHTAKTPGSTAAQTNSRRNARRQAIEEVDEGPHTDESMSIEENAEDDGVEPSQCTAVQNMIMGSLNNVCQNVLI
jgi:hypothetical protein